MRSVPATVCQLIADFGAFENLRNREAIIDSFIANAYVAVNEHVKKIHQRKYISEAC